MLNRSDTELLQRALRRVVLPRNLCHFADSSLIRFENHEALEIQLATWLRAKDPEMLLEGLSNVLYWRFQLEGTGQDDIYDFRAAVRRWSLVDVLRLIDWLDGPGLVSLDNLGLPVFRDLFTLSSLRMVLDPKRYTCLRPLHLQIRGPPGHTVLHEFRPEGTHWPVSLLNETCYERWNQLCRLLGAELDPVWRAADMERALGQLLEDGEQETVLRLLDWAESLREL
jgi:hypothetical protein